MDRDAEYEKLFDNLGYLDTELDDSLMFLSNADDMLESILRRGAMTTTDTLNRIHSALHYVKKAESSIYSMQVERDKSEEAATRLQMYE